MSQSSADEPQTLGGRGGYKNNSEFAMTFPLARRHDSETGAIAGRAGPISRGREGSQVEASNVSLRWKGGSQANGVIAVAGRAAGSDLR